MGKLLNISSFFLFWLVGASYKITMLKIYDIDLTVWANDTAQLLREKRWEEVDWEHFIEIDTFPTLCPYSIDQFLGNWLPS